MSVETCLRREKLYRDRGDNEQADFWKARAERKLNHPVNAHLRPKPEPVKEPVKDGKKSKR